MNLSRRSLIKSTSAVAVGFAALRNITGCAQPVEATPLVDDPQKLGKLPEGFRYQVISRMGQPMSDGLLVPGAKDGMATFVGPNGKTIIIRNHELEASNKDKGAFGKDNQLLSSFDCEMMYDNARGKSPCLGGTSTIVYDTRTRTVDRMFMSLAGTIRNCAGGPTPWGSWVTCEETVQAANDTYEKDHGYNFEVPASTSGLAPPIPLKTMGRFNHEAIAVDPRTGIVYETEDRDNGLVYRFIPNVRGQLQQGGRLQALRILEEKHADTRNWRSHFMSPTQLVAVEWVDMVDVEAPDDELRYRGHFEQGCARFARGEGMWYGHDGIYFACTSGGNARKGQIWKYHPSPDEGKPEEYRNPGKIELFIEPNDDALIDQADNLTIAPWGDIFVCEDRGKKSRIVRVTKEGLVTTFFQNLHHDSELAGVCFSPDGSTLFFNIQHAGITLAITGPWETGTPMLT